MPSRVRAPVLICVVCCPPRLTEYSFVPSLGLLLLTSVPPVSHVPEHLSAVQPLHRALLPLLAPAPDCPLPCEPLETRLALAVRPALCILLPTALHAHPWLYIPPTPPPFLHQARFAELPPTSPIDLMTDARQRRPAFHGQSLFGCPVLPFCRPFISPGFPFDAAAPAFQGL